MRRGFIADMPIPLETLPPRALTRLYSHLLLQESVFTIVLKSAGAGVDASRAAASSIIIPVVSRSWMCLCRSKSLAV